MPLGPHGPRWRTVAAERSVLAVAHTVTALNRLADIVPVFDSDQRVQIIYTCPQASAVTNGVEEHLAAMGALVMPWEQATVTEFDLALSVHNSGNLHDITAPLVILSHGIGYTKYSPGNRKPETGNRKPETGNRSVYGLSRDGLVRNGAVVPRAVVLSHDEQYARLADAVPEALDAAIVAGDPCFDRMAVSEPRRREYRSALGADDDMTVVVVSSTWGPDSLLGRNPNLIAQLLAELPSDRHVVAAVLHPNAWFAHGPAQIRLWLGDCLRAGLRLVPPAEGWQQAVLAADVVVGDFGAVTGYAACAGRATLLASFPEDQIAERSAMGELGRTARRLDPVSAFLPQFDAALADAGQLSKVRELATSLPGSSAAVLRKAFYDLMALTEPPRAPLVPPYAADALLPERIPVAAWWAAVQWHGDHEAEVTRWPADVDARDEQPPNTTDRHLVVEQAHPRRDLHGNAAIVMLKDLGEAGETFTRRPTCGFVVTGEEVVHRDKGVVAHGLSDVDESVACASAIYAWLSAGRTWEALPGRATLRIGSRQIEVALSPPGLPPPPASEVRPPHPSRRPPA
ncbi:hypothetical protein [Lentzea albidocapillata]|uniref:hypothetical protein n=1 Tax=Lentzea albidocapillata TaxID=40571 RepID=UPI0014701BAD|nr:hypothetical protein [Lentzea albidocapillata]